MKYESEVEPEIPNTLMVDGCVKLRTEVNYLQQKTLVPHERPQKRFSGVLCWEHRSVVFQLSFLYNVDRKELTKAHPRRLSWQNS